MPGPRHDVSPALQYRYPGGKNGMWFARCSCGWQTGTWGSEQRATNAVNEHADAKIAYQTKVAAALLVADRAAALARITETPEADFYSVWRVERKQDGIDYATDRLNESVDRYRGLTCTS